MRRVWLWLPLLLGCAAASSPAPRQAPGQAKAAVRLAMAAIAGAPWLADTTGLGPICSRPATCDTVFVEPRILRATPQQTAVLLPERLPIAAELTRADLARLQVPEAVVLAAPREACWARRAQPDWTAKGFACVVVALVAADSLAPVTSVALNVLSPANGYSWLEFTPDPKRGLVLLRYSYE